MRWCVAPAAAGTSAAAAERATTGRSRAVAACAAAAAFRAVQRGGPGIRGFVRAVSPSGTTGAGAGAAQGHQQTTTAPARRTPQPSPDAAAWGYCRDCDAVHSLPKTPRVVEEARCVEHLFFTSAAFLSRLFVVSDAFRFDPLPRARSQAAPRDDQAAGRLRL